MQILLLWIIFLVNAAEGFKILHCSGPTCDLYHYVFIVMAILILITCWGYCCVKICRRDQDLAHHYVHQKLQPYLIK